MFHGSYRPDDVTLLLKPIQMSFMDDLEKKESLIQRGEHHYSEMLSSEKAPSPEYQALFQAAHANNRGRLASNCILLARMLVDRYGPNVTIVSLARAGTPIGVIVHRIISQLLGGESSHYSVSIIRDRGIDTVALHTVLSWGHAPKSIAFVDGWTGKGVISGELHNAIARFNEENGVAIDPALNVLTDLAGTAAAACTEDYLISSSILNATVSGLISRSVLNAAIGTEDFHGCVYFEHLAAHDLSCWFADNVIHAAKDLLKAGTLVPLLREDRTVVAERSRLFMTNALEAYDIEDINLIKPGIGEATRALLRRNPKLLLVRNSGDMRVAHLLVLAKEKNVPVEQQPNLPYHAVSIIRSAMHATRH
jgi:hypothetical protein